MVDGNNLFYFYYIVNYSGIQEFWKGLSYNSRLPPVRLKINHPPIFFKSTLLALSTLNICLPRTWGWVYSWNPAICPNHCIHLVAIPKLSWSFLGECFLSVVCLFLPRGTTVQRYVTQLLPYD